MSRKSRSLEHIDARLRELAAAKSALEQELDHALGRALRRTCEHAPADVWTGVQALLAPHVRNEVDRRALKLALAPGGAGGVSASPAAPNMAPRARGVRGALPRATGPVGVAPAPDTAPSSVPASAAQLSLA